MSDIKVEVEEQTNIREIRKQLEKAIKWTEEEDNVSVRVKVFDCLEFNRQLYDVEISLYLDDEYEEGWINHTFLSRFKDKEDKLALKQANERAKAVLRTVKGWFNYNELVEVEDSIEIYNN